MKITWGQRKRTNHLKAFNASPDYITTIILKLLKILLPQLPVLMYEVSSLLKK